MLRLFLLLSGVLFGLRAASAAELTLPLKPNSVRFAVIGDSGTGEKPQFETAAQMADTHKSFPFEFVIMMGDNIYGGSSAKDYRRKFEDPYRPLLDAGVKFYASLGNHDGTNQRLYKPFNMDGKRYYSFKRGNAEFFALDSNYMNAEQLGWIDSQLSGSSAAWKICFFHHPLYSHARAHGSDLDLRKLLEPRFRANRVNVVFNGHEHVYERLKPQNGIQYFVLGNSGQLRPHDLRASPDTAKGFDTDRAFALVEIAGDELYFQVLSRTGQTVDTGSLTLHETAAGKATAVGSAK
jgi:phosphodiesterase/alkaline phosphatase D-like protein